LLQLMAEGSSLSHAAGLGLQGSMGSLWAEGSGLLGCSSVAHGGGGQHGQLLPPLVSKVSSSSLHYAGAGAGQQQQQQHHGHGSRRMSHMGQQATNRQQQQHHQQHQPHQQLQKQPSRRQLQPSLGAGAAKHSGVAASGGRSGQQRVGAHAHAHAQLLAGGAQSGLSSKAGLLQEQHSMQMSSAR
jgi:hypothetical protein